MTKRVLGRGLDALLSANPVEPGEGRTTRATDELPIDKVVTNEAQPRRRFDPEKIRELAESIRAKGILQPIVVRPKGEEFQIVAGERRFLAAKRAGLESVPVVVRDVPDDEMLQWALIENLQREDLDPVEEAEAFRVLIEEQGLTHETISDLVGRNRTSITNSIRLLRLPDAIRKALVDGKITPGHGRALLQVEDDQARDALFKKIAREGLSVRRVEELARGARPPKKRKSRAPAQRDPQLDALEEKLRLRFGTRVRIRPNGNAGMIEIEYYSVEEFERLFQEMLSGGERQEGWGA